MLPPLLSQNSRQLLTRFFAREGRLSSLKALQSSGSQEASSSNLQSSSSPSTEAASSNSTDNPFKGQLVKNERGHSKFRSPRYSLRRQKQLLKAMELVKLQEELFSPVVAGNSTSIAGEGESVVNEESNPFKVPEHWKLPSSSKSKNLPSFFSADQDPSSVEGAERKHVQSYTAKEATTRGPYKGRKDDPFKLHTWERNKEKVLAERKAKLDNMPERIADYKKSRAASKRDAKPSLPF